MKRRQFTISFATLAGLSTLFGPSAFAALDLAPKNRIANLSMTRECFEARLGQQFAIRGGVVEARLRLIDVKSAIRGRDREQFNVLFEAPEGQLMPEGLYFLEAADKSEIRLHLFAGEPDSGRQQMTATINLQTSA